jgi:hypothetical protein
MLRMLLRTRQEDSMHSPDTRSHSGSDEEPMPMTPSSGMGRHQGILVQPEAKTSQQTDDVEMADACKADRLTIRRAEYTVLLLHPVPPHTPALRSRL